MGDVRELLARDGLAGVQFGTGGRGGGVPEITNMDIRAALGMVPTGLGRELLDWLYASGRSERPEGPQRIPRALDRELALMLYTEKDRLERALLAARLELHIAQDLTSQHHRSEEERVELQYLNGRVAHHHHRVWPDQTSLYPRIRAAVVHEMDGREHCAVCAGRANLLQANLQVRCTACNGSGVVRISGRYRAAWLGVDESSYRRSWRACYEWLHSQVSFAHSDALEALKSALGRIL
jgi:hypothetical protein